MNNVLKERILKRQKIVRTKLSSKLNGPEGSTVKIFDRELSHRNKTLRLFDILGCKVEI